VSAGVLLQQYNIKKYIITVIEIVPGLIFKAKSEGNVIFCVMSICALDIFPQPTDEA